MNTINERIKYLREDLGLSQVKFAQNLGLTQGYINDLEHGRSRLSNALIKLVCLVYCVRDEWLVTGEGEVYKPNKDIDFEEYEELDEREKLFFPLLKNLSQESLQKVMDLIELLEAKQKYEALIRR